MRVLVDECLPRQLRHWLSAQCPDWTVSTVQSAGWAAMKNGALLRAANGLYEVLVTADKNMHHQQNFDGLNISVLVFPTNRVKIVRAGVMAIAQSVPRMSRGQKAIMELAANQFWDSARLVEVVMQGDLSRHVFEA